MSKPAMSSHLLAAALLAAALLVAGLAGTASAAQLKAPEQVSDFGRHAATADLTLPVPAAKSDAEAWPMTESWTIPSAPAGRTKFIGAASFAKPGDAVPGPNLSLQPAADGNGNTSCLAQGNSNAATSSHASLSDVFEHRPDGQVPRVK